VVKMMKMVMIMMMMMMMIMMTQKVMTRSLKNLVKLQTRGCSESNVVRKKNPLLFSDF
jgi:hypothetical protein